jgi:hypothetical protein
MINSLTCIQFHTLLEGVKHNSVIDWNMGEGIDWIRLSKEEAVKTAFAEDTDCGQV